jgi:hypothetical protein
LCIYLRNVPQSKPVESEKPSERFKNAMRQILSVPKTELARREAEYKKQRKIKAHRSPQ